MVMFILYYLYSDIKSGKVGFEPANPHKYWVFTDQIGVLNVGRKWANGHKFDQNRPNPSPKFPAFLKKPT